MSEPENSLIREAAFWLTGAAGGLVDYINQVTRGDRRWSVIGFVVHILSAVFFCYVSGKFALGMHYSPDIALAVGGMGGFFGTRMADIVMVWARKWSGK